MKGDRSSLIGLFMLKGVACKPYSPAFTFTLNIVFPQIVALLNSTIPIIWQNIQLWIVYRVWMVAFLCPAPHWLSVQDRPHCSHLKSAKIMTPMMAYGVEYGYLLNITYITIQINALCCLFFFFLMFWAHPLLTYQFHIESINCFFSGWWCLTSSSIIWPLQLYRCHVCFCNDIDCNIWWGWGWGSWCSVYWQR